MQKIFSVETAVVWQLATSVTQSFFILFQLITGVSCIHFNRQEVMK